MRNILIALCGVLAIAACAYVVATRSPSEVSEFERYWDGLSSYEKDSLTRRMGDEARLGREEAIPALDYAAMVRLAGTLPRYDESQFPLTMRSLVVSGCYVGLDRVALAAILETEADVNDRSGEGYTLLDAYILLVSRSCVGYRLGGDEVLNQFYDDLHFLLDLGAVLGREWGWLEDFSAKLKVEGASTNQVDAAIERIKDARVP